MTHTPFPKTPDGTTDWERVFEEFPDGFVPRIERLETLSELRVGAMEIADRLFSRADDGERLRKLQSWISGIVPEGSTDESSLPKKKKDILRLLRHVQDERTKRAARYVEQKKLAAAQGVNSERRMSSPESIVEEGPPKPKRNFLPVLLAVAVLVAVGAYFLT